MLKPGTRILHLSSAHGPQAGTVVAVDAGKPYVWVRLDAYPHLRPMHFHVRGLRLATQQRDR